jgi:cytochrome c-type biogenesis protein CcmH/NrfF
VVGQAFSKPRLLLLALLTVSLAQSSVPLADARVRSIGEMLKCQCGCGATITSCNMINCHFADPVRVELLRLVEAGKGQQEILDTLVAEHGKVILMKPPAEGFYLIGWVMPFFGVAGGLVLVWVVLNSYLAKRPKTAAAAAGPASSPELDKYRDQIEKDLADSE